MYKYNVYVPAAHGVPQEINIADLIPVGRENAISRSYLVTLCIQNGLVDESLKDPDRSMRQLIARARMDHTILNLSNGEGYYRPSPNDLMDLQRYIRQEENRGKATFHNISNAKALYEDFKRGRLTE